ncbi:50S ribosomal protein L16 [Candidatus Gottesmanbacteria bacterium CG11_big_fil_rev_8_21_14_0_20_37_11]|uniref:Large ribosomal subunit protein uL16 n=3 Tax=Candidatus Gottesmaniibacteriota TaxID=1752720 RepID=A0A2M7RRM9_9BACT|nr:MAG: 50S ribosomal protein L16 [Candidatus Gottesmanbacteria bacterium CG1_02_37_22]PIP32618.1 MAG: 50S ribosomal protein L16 [Candidatus Gottesmanbacteria bacterium CG23_combo_of_CG06-09_8_20_14_all_37_19]PIR08494.1 MAG: 50S ribosomal protein L16 [Candidatus Gottesmanbacteria bacterium CG11_big_fil_rev_8_21_14_0_20_37_11]PIZ02634.1 MAG: 50S ribosomal protein L16 [Candidatus Gottesmanbacteria bacterium CG_4_10_14_0_8_um_filter_37_24]
MLVPKRAKHRKQFRGKMRGNATRGTTLVFGEYGLKSLTSGWLTTKQIEAGRKVLTRYTQKGGRVWIRIFSDKPISDKPPEVRMGGGKGDVVDYVAVIKPGRIIYEMGGISEELAKEAIDKASKKLSIKGKFVKRSER